MSITNPSKPVIRRTHARTFGPQVLFGIAVAATFAVLAGGVTALSSALVAPVASTLLLVMAALAALAGWLRGNKVDAAHLTYWDVAGRRYLGSCSLSDGCGLAPTHRSASFLLTSGDGWLVTAAASGAVSRQVSDFQWDNHAILVR